jgi:hypothetical protein
MNEICLHCHLFYFSSIILSFGHCVSSSWKATIMNTPPTLTPHCWGRLVFCNIYHSYLLSIFGRFGIIWGYFLKYLRSLFLRPLRSKNDRGWILRLRPWNFAIISESLAANLEIVRQTFVWQTVPKFWFICLFHCSSNTYSCKCCKKKDIKVK